MSSKSYRAAQQIFQMGSGAKIELKKPQATKPTGGAGGALKRSWWVGGNLVDIDLSKPQTKVSPNLRKALPNLK